MRGYYIFNNFQLSDCWYFIAAFSILSLNPIFFINVSCDFYAHRKQHTESHNIIDLI